MCRCSSLSNFRFEFDLLNVTPRYSKKKNTLYITHNLWPFNLNCMKIQKEKEKKTYHKFDLEKSFFQVRFESNWNYETSKRKMVKKNEFTHRPIKWMGFADAIMMCSSFCRWQLITSNGARLLLSSRVYQTMKENVTHTQSHARTLAQWSPDVNWLKCLPEHFNSTPNRLFSTDYSTFTIRLIAFVFPFVSFTLLLFRDSIGLV